MGICNGARTSNIIHDIILIVAMEYQLVHITRFTRYRKHYEMRCAINDLN